MKIDEVVKAICKPTYAYGSAGSPPSPKYTILLPGIPYMCFIHCNINLKVELVSCRPEKGSRHH
ncbi:hypothetical protein MKW92_028427 [Papaver armeniacum]|nr:hypothetical protein MKW92_028427 [Papaver armeniacum]